MVAVSRFGFVSHEPHLVDKVATTTIRLLAPSGAPEPDEGEA